MKIRNILLSIVMVGLVGMVSTGCAKKSAKVGGKEKGLQSVYFDFDKSDVRSSETASLKGDAEWLKANGKVKAVIEGNCDERGTPEYNIALGDRRARSAKKYLGNLGVEAARLSTVSFGEEKPAANCHDESCWSKNRRDDLKSK